MNRFQFVFEFLIRWLEIDPRRGIHLTTLPKQTGLCITFFAYDAIEEKIKSIDVTLTYEEWSKVRTMESLLIILKRSEEVDGPPRPRGIFSGMFNPYFRK